MISVRDLLANTRYAGRLSNLAKRKEESESAESDTSFDSSDSAYDSSESEDENENENEDENEDKMEISEKEDHDAGDVDQKDVKEEVKEDKVIPNAGKVIEKKVISPSIPKEPVQKKTEPSKPVMPAKPASDSIFIDQPYTYNVLSRHFMLQWIVNQRFKKHV
jgi:hypothetical protein